MTNARHDSYSISVHKRWTDRGQTRRVGMMRVGIAMLQGARHEHYEAIKHASMEMQQEVEVVELRKAEQVDSSIDGLILPGGESTTMRIASQSESLLEALFDWMTQYPDRPVLGTCAGAILLAQPTQSRASFIEVDVTRNAWGRQRFSFEAGVEVTLETPNKSTTAKFELSRDKFNHKPLPMAKQGVKSTSGEFPGVFIRAPRFIQNSIKCQPIAHLSQEVVGVLQGEKLALTFHPELTSDRRFHRWLVGRIMDAKQ